MVHIDIKKLGRFAKIGHRITGDRTGQRSRRDGGWEFVHVCVDDAFRVALTKIMPDERKESAVTFLKAALTYYASYASLGVTVTRVMTDNGPCYKSHEFRKACADHSLKHIRTKPYTPKTNGKAERSIQTALREWAYATAYNSSSQRAAQLPLWTHRYNWHRPHAGIKSKTPISRLALPEDNLLRLHNQRIVPVSVAVIRAPRHQGRRLHQLTGPTRGAMALGSLAKRHKPPERPSFAHDALE